MAKGDDISAFSPDGRSVVFTSDRETSPAGNCACLSLHHGKTNVPKSRLFTFTPGSADVRVQCYMHTAHVRPQGWYRGAERTLRFSRAFLPGPRGDSASRC